MLPLKSQNTGIACTNIGLILSNACLCFSYSVLKLSPMNQLNLTLISLALISNFSACDTHKSQRQLPQSTSNKDSFSVHLYLLDHYEREFIRSKIEDACVDKKVVAPIQRLGQCLKRQASPPANSSAGHTSTLRGLGSRLPSNATIPYALYYVSGHICAAVQEKINFSRIDLVNAVASAINSNEFRRYASVNKAYRQGDASLDEMLEAHKQICETSCMNTVNYMPLLDVMSEVLKIIAAADPKTNTNFTKSSEGFSELLRPFRYCQDVRCD